MYVVYSHIFENEIVYIGSGKKERAYSKVSRNKVWASELEGKDFRVEILFDNLSKEESLIKEIQLIKDLQPRLNCVTTIKKRLLIPENFNELFYVDPTSESGLRHKVNNKGKNSKNKKQTGDVAGSKKYQSDGRPHAWQIQINNKSYLVHWIVYYLTYGVQNNNEELVLDHIDRNPFNNKVENLRLVTYTDNSVNTTRKIGEIGKRNIYLWTSSKTDSSYWVANYQRYGKKLTKYFSIKKLGSDEALSQAEKWLSDNA